MLLLAQRTEGAWQSAPEPQPNVLVARASRPSLRATEAPPQVGPPTEEELLSSSSILDGELSSDSMLDDELSSGSLLEDELSSGSLLEGELSSGSMLNSSLAGVDSSPAPQPATQDDLALEEGKLSTGSLLEDELGPSDRPEVASTAGAADTLPTRYLTNYPELPNHAPSQQHEFAQTAQRALERVYNQDDIDTALVESLRAQLDGDPALAPLVDAWREHLTEGIRYAQAMQHLGWSVRHLRAAFAEATLDPELAVYRSIDIVKCREAFAKVRQLDEAYMTVPVRVPPAEPQSFRSLELLCQNSHDLRLLNTEFPKNRGPKRARRQLQKSYQKVLRDGRVKRVSLKGGWVKDEGNPNRRTLRGSVGVVRSKNHAFPEDPCTIRDVAMVQVREGRRWSKAKCCEVENIRPVACAELR